MIAAGYEGRSYWVQALALSLLCHGVAAAAMLDVLPSRPDRGGDIPPAQIEVTAIEIQRGTIATAGLSPVSPDGAGTLAPVQPATAPPSAATPVVPVVAPVIAVPTTAGDMLAATVPLAPAQGVDIAALPPAAVTNPGATVATPAPDTPQSRLLAEMIGAIRGQVAQSCLVALPAADGSGAVQLTVLSDRDQGIAAVFQDISGAASAVPLTERSVLLDARQCPALTFARGVASYPVYPLRVALAAPEIASGQRLAGRVTGAGNDPALLLLIDDNGVVQDITRFARPVPDGLEFDVPMRRAGGPRDTSQMLMALAIPDAAALIDGQTGRLAADVFPTIQNRSGVAAQIGIAAFYLR